MAGLYVKQDGVWKLPRSIWVKSGTWRVCNNVYIKEDGSWREMIKSVTLSTNQSNFNLYDYVGQPSQPISLVFTIDSDVIISSSGPSLPSWCPYWCATLRVNLPTRPTAFTVGNFPDGSTVIINNNGYISGGGGYGGAGGYSFSKGSNYSKDYNAGGSRGGNGGHGLVKGSSNSYDCTLVNTGTIAGGGGGGGGAGRKYQPPEGFGSGGYRAGGHGGDGAGITGYSRTQGGTSSTNQNNYDKGVDGGQGGAIGENGQSGQGPSPNGGGGTAGKAIIGQGITIAVSGNIDGVIG